MLLNAENKKQAAKELRTVAIKRSPLLLASGLTGIPSLNRMAGIIRRKDENRVIRYIITGLLKAIPRIILGGIEICERGAHEGGL